MTAPPRPANCIPVRYSRDKDVAVIKSLAYIFFFQLLGEAASRLSGLPVPGSVIGMVLLTAALSLGLIRIQDVAPAADVLVRNMAFLFVPPGVGLMLYFDLIRGQWLAIGLSLLLGTFMVLAVVGLLQQTLGKK